jgi:hypothetical protein
MDNCTWRDIRRRRTRRERIKMYVEDVAWVLIAWAAMSGLTYLAWKAF